MTVQTSGEAGDDHEKGAGAEPGNAAAEAQESMTPFDEIYDRPDPRAFFRTFQQLGYRTPHHAQQIHRRLIATGVCAAEAGAVLDLCCSYGINAALLNHDLTLDDLYDHYTSPRASAMTTSELASWDRDFYRSRRRPDAVPVFGLDAAPNAVAYARRVGLLDEAFGENLEVAPPSAALLRAARRIRLITVTGGASFLSSRTFRPLLESAEAPVWVAALVLRTSSYQPITECLDSFGLITENAAPLTFVQRRFTSPEEQQFAIESVTAAGEDPRGKETDGHFHTAVQLSRPAQDTVSHPLTGLVHPA
ncbi:hypothetical protein EES39_30330 [Streptomyces sp. ADI92-24]|uniref:hypothetical protein n=1 Tax=unclassified Streptomyces TaxID=2593676 RepID=UPI000FBD140F|nr:MULTISPECIES: hypothetical protein [unclassified Streptomyces]ROQ78220.1 hypothetical protein EDD95_4812 [Streptomyces sp. CEV 2-1]RPK37892.1 hypothetical protein EES39_30330 [Streptomyces sp. ADI92-24]